MKESELKDYERHALEIYRHFSRKDVEPTFSTMRKTKSLYEFGKEIAEKLEPELKPVDMSVLVNSGIDCVFWDWHGREYMDFLIKIGKGDATFGSSKGLEPKCKPRMNYWFSAENFDDTFNLIDRLEKAGFVLGKSYLRLDDGDLHLKAFKIKGLQDGCCWPWEVE